MSFMPLYEMDLDDRDLKLGHDEKVRYLSSAFFRTVVYKCRKKILKGGMSDRVYMECLINLYVDSEAEYIQISIIKCHR